MGTFGDLVKLKKRLSAPDGCQWDREQTRESYWKHIREEADELIEAIEEDDVEHIREEIGDLIWTLIFYADLCESEGIFTLDECLEDIKEKIIRRHPHVFGDVEVSSVEEINDNWERIKREERQE